jgi:hypothetical protein
LARKKRGRRSSGAFSLADLQDLVEAKEREIGGFQSEREALLARMQQIDGMIAAASGGGRGGRRRSGRPAKAKGARKAGRRFAGRRGKRRGGARGESGLAAMIAKVLKDSKEPVKLAEIAKRVLAAGYETSSGRFGVIVGQRLSEMKGVKKAGRGLYSLK